MDPKIFIKTVPNPPKIDKKKIFIGLSVAIILFAIPLGVYLVNQRTDIFPQALDDEQEEATASATPVVSVGPNERCDNGENCPTGYSCQPLSTCINTASGSACTDIVGSVCKLVTESSASASPSPQTSQTASSSAKPSPQVVKGDANNDGKIELVDLSVLFSNWNKVGLAEIDFNGDGIINSFDFASMVNLLKEKNLVTGT